MHATGATGATKDREKSDSAPVYGSVAVQGLCNGRDVRALVVSVPCSKKTFFFFFLLLLSFSLLTVFRFRLLLDAAGSCHFAMVQTMI